MQPISTRRTNKERSDTTRTQLLSAARDLFAEHGYDGVSTPLLVEKAGVTRGALYHHFQDKRALFAAVAESEAAAVADQIEAAAPAGMNGIETIVSGGEAYLFAMQEPGRSRLLLLDAPAVLGYATCDEMDKRHARRTLREGLEAAMAAGLLPPLPVSPLTQMLSAAFDRAALGIAAGDPPEEWRLVLKTTVERLAVA